MTSEEVYVLLIAGIVAILGLVVIFPMWLAGQPGRKRRRAARREERRHRYRGPGYYEAPGGHGPPTTLPPHVQDTVAARAAYQGDTTQTGGYPAPDDDTVTVQADWRTTRMFRLEPEPPLDLLPRTIEAPVQANPRSVLVYSSARKLLRSSEPWMAGGAVAYLLPTNFAEAPVSGYEGAFNGPTDEDLEEWAAEHAYAQTDVCNPIRTETIGGTLRDNIVMVRIDCADLVFTGPVRPGRTDRVVIFCQGLPLVIMRFAEWVLTGTEEVVIVEVPQIGLGALGFDVEEMVRG